MFRIYVGNLSFRTTPEALREHFASHGEVLDVFIGTDRETGRSRGFGFVTMADKDAGNNAITALNGKEFEGRALVVNEARPGRRRRRRRLPRRPRWRRRRLRWRRRWPRRLRWRRRRWRRLQSRPAP
jgi:RNA recognition motif-containing protein